MRRLSLLALVVFGGGSTACGSSGEVAPDAHVAPAMYHSIADTGLYADLATKTLAADAVEFMPGHVLWADGADKRRWIHLPPGTQIDTSDMDHWKFPVGTQFWKEFSLGGVLLETRLIEHVSDTGDDMNDYWVGAFVWLADGSDAILAPTGQMNINGTPHDAPSQTQCWSCHIGEAGHALGFSFVQLSRAASSANDVTVDWLVAKGLLSAPPDGAYTIPGDETTAAALGYLHANCGHCHNPHGIAWPNTQQVLRLTSTELEPETTQIYLTTVGVPLQSFDKPPFQDRIVAGDPAASAIYYRMTQRGNLDAMPSLATEVVDQTGVDTVGAWISELTQ